MKKTTVLIAGIVTTLFFNSCLNKANKINTDANLKDSIKETFSIANLVQEVKTVLTLSSNTFMHNTILLRSLKEGRFHRVTKPLT